jgi:hypothetical protein
MNWGRPALPARCAPAAVQLSSRAVPRSSSAAGRFACRTSEPPLHLLDAADHRHPRTVDWGPAPRGPGFLHREGSRGGCLMVLGHHQVDLHGPPLPTRKARRCAAPGGRGSRRSMITVLAAWRFRPPPCVGGQNSGSRHRS